MRLSGDNRTELLTSVSFVAWTFCVSFLAVPAFAYPFGSECDAGAVETRACGVGLGVPVAGLAMKTGADEDALLEVHQAARGRVFRGSFDSSFFLSRKTTLDARTSV